MLPDDAHTSSHGVGVVLSGEVAFVAHIKAGFVGGGLLLSYQTFELSNHSFNGNFPDGAFTGVITLQ
jgi:hypothetical protein